MSVPVAVFASGSGTNFQALLDHERTHDRGRIELLITDRAQVGSIDRARAAGREHLLIPVQGRPPNEVEDETLENLRSRGIQVVLLAGYLRLVPAKVVAGFRRRILNVHPALLPAFGGKGMWGQHVHRAVIDSGAKVSGVTVHYVDERYDEGTILSQWPVPVRPDDTPASLSARVIRVEHVLYPVTAEVLCRAVGESRDPAPFRPPYDLFVGTDDSTQSLTNQIREAFGA